MESKNMDVGLNTYTYLGPRKNINIKSIDYYQIIDNYLIKSDGLNFMKSLQSEDYSFSGL